MARILIAYASRHGHTANIADVVRRAGHRVTIASDVAREDPLPHDSDAAIANPRRAAPARATTIQD